MNVHSSSLIVVVVVLVVDGSDHVFVVVDHTSLLQIVVGAASARVAGQWPADVLGTRLRVAANNWLRNESAR